MSKAWPDDVELKESDPSAQNLWRKEVGWWMTCVNCPACKIKPAFNHVGYFQSGLSAFDHQPPNNFVSFPPHFFTIIYKVFNNVLKKTLLIKYVLKEVLKLNFELIFATCRLMKPTSWLINILTGVGAGDANVHLRINVADFLYLVMKRLVPRSTLIHCPGLSKRSYLLKIWPRNPKPSVNCTCLGDSISLVSK